MDFFGSSKGKRTGLFGKKSTTSKSTPPSPPHGVGGSRSPPPYYLSNKRAESEYAFPAASQTSGYYRKPPASERIPNSHHRPPVYGYYSPDRRGKENTEVAYEPEANVTPRNSAPPSPVHPAPPYSSSSDDDQSTYLYPEISSGLHSKPVSASSTPVHYKSHITAETYDVHDKLFEPPELPDDSQSFTLYEIAKMRGLKNYDLQTAPKEDIQSVISESYVSVANYRVRSSVSATLRSILDKYGDIAASSKLQSTSTRSYYLESLAAAVLELKTTSLGELTTNRVSEIAAVVKDMESVRIDVSWLKIAVEELAEAVEYFGQHEAAKAEKEACDVDLTAGRTEMDDLTAELGRREKEIKECREKVTATAARLGQLEMKGSRLNKNLDLFKSKVDKFDGEAVLVDV